MTDQTEIRRKSLFFSTLWQHFGNLSEMDKFLNKSTNLIKEEILNFSSPIYIK